MLNKIVAIIIVNLGASAFNSISNCMETDNRKYKCERIIVNTIAICFTSTVAINILKGR